MTSRHITFKTCLCVFALVLAGCGGTGGEKAQARAHAGEALWAVCREFGTKDCRVTGVRHIGGPLWRASYSSRKLSGCVDIDLHRFAVYNAAADTTGRFHGVGWVRC